ncbi:MAG TPA: triose-phosphate isomerase [Myxococcaceae bacterium]|nr:triose-phosphate isomerase [Myxococcaceae bacterium]
MTSPRRKPLVAGNWKMHRTGPEAVELIRQLLDGYRPNRAEVMVAPPFTALESASRALEGSGVALGAQNVHWEAQGAFTGEVSAGMLKALGCAFVIVGHSERRQLFGETDSWVSKKARAVLHAGMRPVVCIGETLAERDAGRTLEVCTTQLQGSLAGVAVEEMTHVVLAYEPVWAIGTGRNATPAQAQEVHAHVREQLVGVFGRPVGESVRILYGGSVKADNAAELLGQADVDGALVGGASLKAQEFLAIVAAAG